MNFGETLAYWYLRLNGFFPLRNFVLHAADIGASHAGDTDLLAVRFPFTYEEIGGKDEDWDTAKFREWGIDLQQSPVAVIGDVKTGRYNELTTWRAGRLQAAIQRFGFVPPRLIPNVVGALEQTSIHQYEDWIIAKILFSRNSDERNDCLNISLNDVEQFITNRFTKHKVIKDADRFLFPDELIQYFAYKSNID